MPLRKGSVFDAFKFIWMTRGDNALSTAISLKLRWTAGSYSAADGIVTSPERKNPKKQVTNAAQSIRLLKSGCWVLKSRRWIALKISGVTGRRGRGRLPFLASASFIPLRTYCSLGISVVNGSGRD